MIKPQDFDDKVDVFRAGGGYDIDVLNYISAMMERTIYGRTTRHEVADSMRRTDQIKARKAKNHE